MRSSKNSVFSTVSENLDSRRGFLTRLGLASAGVGAFLSAGAPARAQQATDVDVLQFALNLEYLTAEFYTMAVSGKTIDQFDIQTNGSGNAGATSGGRQVTFIAGSTLQLSATQIAADERAHVSLLRTALANDNGTPAAKPAINLDALGVGFASQEEFLSLARAMEDTTVAAYCSLIQVIQSHAYLDVAARLLADEGQHAGNVRLHTALYNVTTAAIDGADIVPPPTGNQFISANSAGLATVRTPPQVLYIAFGKANQTSGGFFPAGVNGMLNTSGPAATA